MPSTERLGSFLAGVPQMIIANRGAQVQEREDNFWSWVCHN